MKLLFFVVNLVAVLATQPATDPKLALTGLDPVLLIEGEKQEGHKDWTIVYGGFRYLFANEATMKKFTGDPDRYSVQLRGACPVRPDLQGRQEIFKVHQGRIYLFYSEHCRERFEKDPESYLGVGQAPPAHPRG